MKIKNIFSKGFYYTYKCNNCDFVFSSSDIDYIKSDLTKIKCPKCDNLGVTKIKHLTSNRGK